MCFNSFYWTQNYFLKFKEIFQWRETALSANRMKSYEKPFFCQNYAIFLEKNGTCCDWKVFFFIFKVIWRFFLSLTVPLTFYHVYFPFQLIDVNLWNAFCEVSPRGSFLNTLQRQKKKVCNAGGEVMMKIHYYLLVYTTKLHIFCPLGVR